MGDSYGLAAQLGVGCHSTVLTVAGEYL